MQGARPLKHAGKRRLFAGGASLPGPLQVDAQLVGFVGEPRRSLDPGHARLGRVVLVPPNQSPHSPQCGLGVARVQGQGLVAKLQRLGVLL